MANERLPAAVRRSQLIASAIEVFADAGYHSTTMDEIAAHAGITKPVLYQHFDSKKELFLELLRDIGRRLSDEVITAAAEAEGPHEQVARGFRAYFRFVATEAKAFRLLFGDGVRADDDFASEVRSVERTLAQVIADLILIEGLDADGRLLLAHGIIGLAESTGRYWHAQGRPGDPDELAQQVAALAWSGLRT